MWSVLSFAAVLFLTLYLVFLGYQIAGGGLDALFTGRKVVGTVLFWSGILLACGSALFLPWGGHWLVFERGFGGLLMP